MLRFNTLEPDLDNASGGICENYVFISTNRSY